MTMIRRTLANRKNLSYVAWVAIGTGSVFLTLALPLPALGAFVVGACCAYAGRNGGRRDVRSVAACLAPPQPGDSAKLPPSGVPTNAPNQTNEQQSEATMR
ncbi:hypothetical protein EVC45_24515 [Paraburkholderia sp. UYCP14C]|nr:hypothetical protein EVC45_24515 [Paraburkholderia sp. UYCP14C]